MCLSSIGSGADAPRVGGVGNQKKLAAPPEGDAARDAVADRSPRDARSEVQRLLSFLDDEVEDVVGLVRAVLPPERVGAIGHHEVW